MALLYFSDFNEPVTSTSWAESQRQINHSNGGAAADGHPAGEDGRGYLWGDNQGGTYTGRVDIAVPSYSGGLIFGYRWNCFVLGAQSGGFSSPHLQVEAGATVCLSLRYSGSSIVQVRDSAGTEVATFSAPVSSWNTIELNITPGGIGVGSCKLAVNGVVLFDDSTTYNWGSGTIDNIYCGSTGTYDLDGQLMDRFWFADTTGSYVNDLTGGVKAEYVAPDGNGNSSQWVGSDGNSTDNYQLVDENPLSTADYVQAGTQGDTDLYTYAALSGGDGIVAVQLLPYLSLPDGGSRFVRAVTRVSATTYTPLGSTPVLDGEFAHFGMFLEENPNATAAWTASTVDGAEFGLEVRDT